MKPHLRTVAVAAALSLACVTIVSANHVWGGYHWARTANPFTVKLGDNLTTNWNTYLATTSVDWTLSTVLDPTIVPGQSSKNCRATLGRVEVCNSKYGNNGWLGIAQVWVSGTHIQQGTVKMNDTYFNTAKYNTPAWKNLVLCQEVGHTFGLDHQDENFSNANLGTCMDYTNDPTSNQHPNAHDYEQLELLYAHLDSTTTIGSSLPASVANADVSQASAWGQLMSQSANGKTAVYAREFGNGHTMFTFVTWTEEKAHEHHHD